MRLSPTVCMLFLLTAALVAVPATADSLKEDASWTSVTSKGYSLVFGRLAGRFDGADFRDRNLEFRRLDDGKKFDVSVGEGLGYFEALLPPGYYEIKAVEATYSPIGRPINPQRYRPVRQRYGVSPKPSEMTKQPSIHIPRDRPVYMGTVEVDNDPDGIVYRGHYIGLVNEFDEAFERLAKQFPKFANSLMESEATRFSVGYCRSRRPHPQDSGLYLRRQVSAGDQLAEHLHARLRPGAKPSSPSDWRGLPRRRQVPGGYSEVGRRPGGESGESSRSQVVGACPSLP